MFQKNIKIIINKINPDNLIKKINCAQETKFIQIEDYSNFYKEFEYDKTIIIKDLNYLLLLIFNLINKYKIIIIFTVIFLLLYLKR